MSAADVDGPPDELPAGYVAIPATGDQAHVPLRVCAVVRREPDPVAGHLVVLRDLIDAQVLLGCLMDAGGRVQRWLELWVQNLEALAYTVTACREALSNKVLDERWERRFRAMERMEADAAVSTGWETAHPLPTFLDLAALEPVHPSDPATGAPWTLCQDDHLLLERGLPAYSSSLERYLYLPGDTSTFVPVTPEAPTNENTRPLQDLLREHGELIELNPGAGLMMVREFCPVEYEAYVDLLGGGSWEGLLHGRSPIKVGTGARELNEADPGLPLGGRLFLGEHGRWGRILETFHLKLRLLSDAVVAVRAMAEAHQRPLLNLSAESFQIRLGKPGRGLPFLWTARAILADPGDAVALSVPGSEVQYYLRAGSATTSVYRPETAGAPTSGRGTVRIRRVVLGTREQMIIEGTFNTQERVDTGHMDLLWLRLSLAEGRLDLHAYVDPDSAMAAGELRFRTVGRRLTEAEAVALKAAEGVPLRNTPFQVVALLSTPCDLYGLGVLAVRTLLVDTQTTLPVALDEALSLAHQVAVDHDGATDLSTRIHRLFDTDRSWVMRLGPQRLTHDDVSPEDAFDLVPAELWWDTLAAIVRMFPGIGPDSTCRDFGDAPAGGIHKILDRTVSDLDNLLLRTRSLIVIDWRFNREIHAVIRSHLTGLPQAQDG